MREQGFGWSISLIPSPHNLHNYDELGVTYRHRPFGSAEDPRTYLTALYPEMHELISTGCKVMVHGEEVGDRVDRARRWLHPLGRPRAGRAAGRHDHRADQREAARPVRSRPGRNSPVTWPRSAG